MPYATHSMPLPPPSRRHRRRHGEDRPVHHYARPKTTTITTTTGKTGKTGTTPTYAATSTTGPPSSRRPKSNTKASAATKSSSSSRPRGYPRPLGRGNGFPLVHRTRFLRLQSVTLRVSPDDDGDGGQYSAAAAAAAAGGRGRGCGRGRGYRITDGQGITVFRVLPGSSCLRETKTLLDARNDNRCVLRAHHVVLTTRASVFVRDERGRALLFLQRMNMVNLPKVVHGFIRCKAYGKADVVISEERHQGRAYVIRDRRSNEIACIQRFRVSSRKDKHKRYAYKLYISAGYDCALFVMCSVLLLDMWNK